MKNWEKVKVGYCRKFKSITLIKLHRGEALVSAVSCISSSSPRLCLIVFFDNELFHFKRNFSHLGFLLSFEGAYIRVRTQNKRQKRIPCQDTILAMIPSFKRAPSGVLRENSDLLFETTKAWSNFFFSKWLLIWTHLCIFWARFTSLKFGKRRSTLTRVDASTEKKKRNYSCLMGVPVHVARAKLKVRWRRSWTWNVPLRAANEMSLRFKRG